MTPAAFTPPVSLTYCSHSVTFSTSRRSQSLLGTYSTLSSPGATRWQFHLGSFTRPVQGPCSTCHNQSDVEHRRDLSEMSLRFRTLLKPWSAQQQVIRRPGSVVPWRDDKHCPCIEVRRRPRPATPWFDAECCDARCKARAAERRFRRWRTEEDKRVWAMMRELYQAKCSSF